MDKIIEMRLIRKIADKLVDEDWPMLDFTLRQFGLSGKALGSDKLSYILESLERANDEQIINITKYLKLEPDSEINKNDEKSIVQFVPFRLFISHVSSVKVFAHSLKDSLSSYNIISFVAHDDIEPTREWQNEIEMSLSNAHSIVALFNEGFHESNWTDQEVGTGIGRGILIIPVRFELDPYGFIGKYQGLQGNGKIPVQIASEIFNILVSNENTKIDMTLALVDKFRNSDSYRSAQHNVDLLGKIQYINEAIIDEIQIAVESNNQISGAFGVKSKVNSLISRLVDEYDIVR